MRKFTIYKNFIFALISTKRSERNKGRKKNEENR